VKTLKVFILYIAGAEMVLAEMGVYLIKPKDATVLLDRRIEYAELAGSV